MPGISPAGLRRGNMGPAIIYDVPGSIDQYDGMSGPAKAGPGGLVRGISIPLPGLFYYPVIYGIYCLITEVLKPVIGKIPGDIGTIVGKTGDLPFATGHSQQDKVFLFLFNSLLATGR
jgi:hypothetical protein